MLKESTNELNSLSSQLIRSQLEQLLEENNFLADSIKEIVRKIRNIFEPLKKYDKKLDLINGFIKNSKGSRRSSIQKKRKIEYTDYIDINHIEDWNFVDSKYFHLYSFYIILVKKRIINFVMNFQMKFYFSYMYMTSKIFSQNYENKSNNNRNSFEVLSMFSAHEKKEQILESLIQEMEVNNKNVPKACDEIFNQGSEVKKKKKKDKHSLRTTLNSIHDDYYRFNIHENKTKNIEVLNFSKKLMMKEIQRFTNELVDLKE